MPVNAPLAETMKAETFLNVLILVFLALSPNSSGARRRLHGARYRERSTKIRKFARHHMWPNCTAVEHGLADLVNSAIVGQISKKLLQKCGYEQELPQLEMWREGVSKLLDDHTVDSVISWIIDELQNLLRTHYGLQQAGSAKASNGEHGHEEGSANSPVEIQADVEGPPAPEICHDYTSFVQIVDDEPNVRDDDWPKVKRY